MTPERYHRVCAVFEAAVKCGPAGHEALLAEACAGDPSLRAEVERLLAADAEAVQEAENLRFAGRLDAALHLLDPVLAVRPADREVLALRAELRDRLRKSHPPDAKAIGVYNRGLEMLRQGKYLEAIESFREAMRLDSDHGGEAPFGLGRILALASASPPLTGLVSEYKLTALQPRGRLYEIIGETFRR